MREITEMYTILFSHPLVEAITTWDFTDRCWLNAPSGFLRADDSEKPSYFALHDLIHGAWETHETLKTDADGCLSFTGFKGNYTLTAGSRVMPITLEEDMPQVRTLIVP